MKKLKLFGMFALTFALLFGVVACSNGSKNDDLEDVLKEDADLSGTWEITDVDVDFDLSGDIPDEAKDAFEEGLKIQGKKIDELTLDEKIETFCGGQKSITFATKEEAKAFFDEMVKSANEINEKFKNGTVDDSFYGFSGKVDGEAYVEINKDQTEVISGSSMSVETSEAGYNIKLSMDMEITYTKK